MDEAARVRHADGEHECSDGASVILRGSPRKRRKLDYNSHSSSSSSSSFSCPSSSSSGLRRQVEVHPVSAKSSSFSTTQIQARQGDLSSAQPFQSNEIEDGCSAAWSRRCTQIDAPTIPYLDECYLHHLPQDLIISNIVASRLPLLDLIRARAVCTSWRDSIFSPLIKESFVANPDCGRSRLLVEHSSASGPSLAVFDALENCWSVVPIRTFGRLVAASQGLFCFVTDAGRPPSLVVGNPLTNQWKPLPEIPLSVPAHGPQLIAMAAKTQTGTYRVTVLFGLWDDDATDAYLPFVYDSISEKWTQRRNISARLSFATSRSAVKPPDILLSIDSNAGSLLSYDMTNNIGDTLQLRNLPSLINEEDPKTNLWRRLPQIAVCEGMPFLVARCLGERAPVYKLGQLPIVQHSSVGVWSMKEKCDAWEFVTCMPLDLLETLVKGSDGTDFIIASNGGSKLFFMLKGSLHMLVYDPALCTWTLLPGCPADYNSYPLHQSAFYEPLLWVYDL